MAVINKAQKKKVRFGGIGVSFGGMRGIEVLSNRRMGKCSSQISRKTYPNNLCIQVYKYNTCINLFFVHF